MSEIVLRAGAGCPDGILSREWLPAIQRTGMLHGLTQQRPCAQVDFEHRRLPLTKDNLAAVPLKPKPLLTFWSSRKEMEEAFSWRGDEGKQVGNHLSPFWSACPLESELYM